MVRLVAPVDSRFIALVISSAFGRSYIAAVKTQQVGQANVNGTKLAAMRIPLPPAAEQQRIVGEVERRFSILDAMEQAIEGGLKRAGGLRQAILREAFAGRLVSQDPSG